MEAFARVLSRHGYAGATMTSVAAEAGLSPGLLHHHFEGKREMLDAVVDALIARFQRALRIEAGEDDPLRRFVDAALERGVRADAIAARCWVSVFGEALRDPGLLDRVRRLVSGQVGAIQRLTALGGGVGLSQHEATAVLAYVVGCLVVGVFAPKTSAGFAAPGGQVLVRALRELRSSSGRSSLPRR